MIKCQNLQVIFWQLIESSNNGILCIKTFDQVPKFASYFLAVDRIFWSTEKRLKFWSTDYETFDQLKNDNFDQLIFSQTTPCPPKTLSSSVIRPIFIQSDSLPISIGVRCWSRFHFLLLHAVLDQQQQLQPLRSLHFLQRWIIIIIKYIYMFLSFYDLD